MSSEHCLPTLHLVPGALVSSSRLRAVVVVSAVAMIAVALDSVQVLGIGLLAFAAGWMLAELTR